MECRRPSVHTNGNSNTCAVIHSPLLMVWMELVSLFLNLTHPNVCLSDQMFEYCEAFDSQCDANTAGVPPLSPGQRHLPPADADELKHTAAGTATARCAQPGSRRPSTVSNAAHRRPRRNGPAGANCAPSSAARHRAGDTAAAGGAAAGAGDAAAGAAAAGAGAAAATSPAAVAAAPTAAGKGQGAAAKAGAAAMAAWRPGTAKLITSISDTSLFVGYDCTQRPECAARSWRREERRSDIGDDGGGKEEFVMGAQRLCRR
ncbi:hypothetical protein B0H11DRAFT_1939800 [Mycena galericulata]|nr:hypothetical protein B0H11DRAFT_1939800 [Mycena galericulata]